MKYLKLFDNHQDYEDYQPDMLTPNVSYCQLEDEVHFNEFRYTRLVAKFNVTSTSEPTNIISVSVPYLPPALFSSIEIDGVNMETLSTQYTFETTGEHIVKYTLLDPTETDNLFNSCEQLTHVVIPNSITAIGESMFNSCHGLTSIDIPNSVTSIGMQAFLSCYSLTNITIPNSVTSIGDEAFADCNIIDNVIIPDSVITIDDNAFDACVGMTAITLSNSLTTIGEHAFDACESLVSIDIPNSVTTIGNFAFHDCTGLLTVTLGTGVSQIGRNAFSNGSSLTSITSRAMMPASLTGGQDGRHLTYWSFNNTNGCPIYVPSESLELYKAQWALEQTPAILQRFVAISA